MRYGYELLLIGHDRCYPHTQSWNVHTGYWSHNYMLNRISLVLDNSQTQSPDQTLSAQRIYVVYRFAEGDCCNGTYGPYTS